MTEREYLDRFHELEEEYIKKFGDEDGGICIYSMPPMSSQELLDTIQHCIDTNTPYKYDGLPEGCIA